MNKQLNLKVPSGLLETLKEKAKKYGITYSELARWYLIKSLGGERVLTDDELEDLIIENKKSNRRK